MGSASPVEGFPRSRVAFPQRVVGLAVQTADRLPFVEDCAQPVAGSFPLRRGVGQLLGLDGQGLLAGRLGCPMLVPTGALGGGDSVGMLTNAGKPRGQRIDITENMCGRQRFAQLHRVGLDLARVARARSQPLLHQRDLGAQVVESPTEMRERGFDVARLPRSDDPFAGRADQPYRPVGVDASESVWIVGQRPGDWVRVRAGCWFGHGSRSRPWYGPGFVMGLFRRHELPSPTLRAAIGRAPAAHCGAVKSRGRSYRHSRLDLTSIEAACWAVRSQLALAVEVPR